MQSLYNVIQKFVVTNKSTDAELRGVYTCIVHPDATKIDVKSAFKALYGVDAVKVNVSHTREKFHNTKFGMVAKKTPEKKMMVTLKDGQKINDFQAIK